MYFPNFLLKHKYICLLTEVPYQSFLECTAGSLWNMHENQNLAGNVQRSWH